jgi:hypothetical protein
MQQNILETLRTLDNLLRQTPEFTGGTPAVRDEEINHLLDIVISHLQIYRG